MEKLTTYSGGILKLAGIVQKKGVMNYFTQKKTDTGG